MSGTITTASSPSCSLCLPPRRLLMFVLAVCSDLVFDFPTWSPRIHGAKYTRCDHAVPGTFLVTFWDDALFVVGFTPRTCCSQYPRCLRRGVACVMTEKLREELRCKTWYMVLWRVMAVKTERSLIFSSCNRIQPQRLQATGGTRSLRTLWGQSNRAISLLQLPKKSHVQMM